MTSRPMAVVALVATILAGCAASSGASPTTSLVRLADVLTYKGNAARTGEHPGPGPAAAPASVWRVEHASLFRTAPLITDGQLVAGAEDGTLFVIDPADGGSANLKIAGGFRATGTIANGILYVAGRDGMLHSIELSGLKPGWNVDGVHEESFITVAGDLVVAGAADELVAFARVDGKERWRVAAAGAERMALANEVIYAGGRESGTLTAVGLDRVERWTFDTGGAEVLTPLVAGDVLYVATRGGEGDPSRVIALDLDGGELWTADVDERIDSHGVDGNRVYVAIQEDPSRLLALDQASGETVWEHEFDALTVSVLAIADGRVYVVSQAEGLVALEADSGDVAWQVELGDVARAGLAITGGSSSRPRTFRGVGGCSPSDDAIARRVAGPIVAGPPVVTPTHGTRRESAGVAARRSPFVQGPRLPRAACPDRSRVRVHSRGFAKS